MWHIVYFLGDDWLRGLGSCKTWNFDYYKWRLGKAFKKIFSIRLIAFADILMVMTFIFFQMKVFEDGAGKASPGGLWALDMREGGSEEPVRLVQTQIQIQIQTHIQIHIHT